MAQVGPHEAKAHIVEWWEKTGYPAPQLLQHPHIDAEVTIICFLLVILWIVGVWVFDRRGQLFPNQYPERHKEILHNLADELAEVQNLSLAKAYWNSQTHHTLRQDHFEKLTAARTRAENLNEQIPYDPDTMQTVRDFLQAAHIVVHDALQNWDDRQSRADLDRIAKGLFRYLHDGKAADRRKIDLPDWCHTPAPVSAPPAPSPAKPVYRNERDAEFCDGIIYIATGTWGGQMDAVFNQEPGRFTSIIDDIAQRARDNKVTVWGRPGDGRFNDSLDKRPWKIVPPEHWDDHHIIPTMAAYGNARTENRHDHKIVEGTYRDLMVSKFQFEREWPHA